MGTPETMQPALSPGHLQLLSGQQQDHLGESPQSKSNNADVLHRRLQCAKSKVAAKSEENNNLKKQLVDERKSFSKRLKIHQEATVLAREKGEAGPSCTIS